MNDIGLVHGKCKKMRFIRELDFIFFIVMNIVLNKFVDF